MSCTLQASGSQHLQRTASLWDWNADYTVSFYARNQAFVDGIWLIGGAILHRGNWWDGSTEGVEIVQHGSPSFPRVCLNTMRDWSGGQPSGTTELFPDTWDHYVFVREGSTVTIYLNGVAEVTRAAASGGSGPSAFTLGRFLDTYRDMEVAFVNVWTRALTTGEIEDQMEQGAAVSTTDLWASWPLEEDEDDVSGNGRHLTVYGSPTFDDSDDPVPYEIGGAPNEVTGASAGEADASGTATTPLTSSGAASGDASSAATASVTITATGTSTGDATAAATAATPATAAGASAGDASAAGTATTPLTATGTSAGDATTTAAAATPLSATGTSSADAWSSGEATQETVTWTASGQSEGSAESSGTATTPLTASGASTTDASAAGAAAAPLTATGTSSAEASSAGVVLIGAIESTAIGASEGYADSIGTVAVIDATDPSPPGAAKTPPARRRSIIPRNFWGQRAGRRSRPPS